MTRCAFLHVLLLIALGVGTGRAQGEASWTNAGSLATARTAHTATLLPSGQVLVAAGRNDGGPLASAELYDPAAGVWTPAAPLAHARSGHTATLLPKGEVLVVGGNDPTAELYDPLRGTWEPTASPGVARTGHTATLLPSGDVLVVGGEGTEASSSAELYDPAARAWKPAGSVAGARAAHTATLLPSGMVLVAGGEAQQSSAELYDPARRTWQLTGSLAGARAGHDAILLLSGKVLVSGGSRGEELLRDAELYDPATGHWVSAGSFAGEPDWVGTTATLLASGRVLVAGPFVSKRSQLYDPVTGTWEETAQQAFGRYDSCATLLASGKVLVSGGESAIVPLRSAELYDSGAGAWQPAADLARRNHSATLLPSGEVLVAGGEDRAALSSAELYDPASGVWSPTGSLKQARYLHSATLLPSGKVLVAGGQSGDEKLLLSAELYDPLTAAWRKTGPLTRRRTGHTATLLLSGKVLVTGGTTKSFDSSSSAELYDPATGTWTATGSLLHPRFTSTYTATLLHSGQVLVTGGDAGYSAELYDPLTGTWAETGPLHSIRFNHAAALLPSGQVLVAGGWLDGAVASAEIYDPATGSWSETGPLADGRGDHTATLLLSGEVLVAGGSSGDTLALESELFDPATGTWRLGAALARGRSEHSATLLANGRVLLAGGMSDESTADGAELYDPADYRQDRRPLVTSASAVIRYGRPASLSGARLGGASEASGGDTQSSAVNYPLLQMLAIEGGQLSWLLPDPMPSFRDDPMALTVSHLPPTLGPGWHRLTAITAGVASESRLVQVKCSLEITEPPADRIAAIGSTATFRVKTQGGRLFQWQRDGVDLPGATGPAYTTPPITGADSGSTYRVRVGSGCTGETSKPATLTVEDGEPPAVEVIAPGGGEYWLLSSPDKIRTEVVTWSMSDNVRICRIEASLLYSDDGGETYRHAAGPMAFGPGGTCRASEAPVRTYVRYTLPEDPPSAAGGSLYKVQVRVTDHAGLASTARSRNPFFIVRPNPDSVKTLILSNVARMRETMEVSGGQAASLARSLELLAEHPRVQGRVIDLGGITGLSRLYRAWDRNPSSARAANRLLFGDGGVQDHLQKLLEAYTGVQYVILVGDDRILPMARIQDRTMLLLEENYPAGRDLTARGTTVGRALAANRYLSDDPLAVLDRVEPEGLSGSLFLPDLMLGRLVESPEEIVKAIAAFISRDGILDLTAGPSDHKVLVTGYDFLVDSASRIRRRWKNAFGLSEPHDDHALSPVDGRLLSDTWSLALDERPQALRAHLEGRADRAAAATPYGIVSLNGHATHYQEGVPGSSRLDVQGLAAEEIRELELAGSVVYAVGCHGGLPVAGSSSGGPDHSLDLPQTLLSRGVQAYVANTGYGWGLTYGVGYGERLVELFTEELARSGSIVVGEAYRQAKLRYRMEALQLDAYDQKSLMQWAFFGFPMYVVKTGIAAAPAGRRGRAGEAAPGMGFGDVSFQRRLTGGVRVGADPGSPAEAGAGVQPNLTRLDLHFDLTAAGIYTKHEASGAELDADNPGCPDPDGCYYTLNGRATGAADLPIQPYFVYDSRLSGTSQHGVLWRGGSYEEERGWRPVVAELVSNGELPEQDPIPEHVILEPDGPFVVRGRDPALCRPSDLELNSLVVTTGELLREEGTDALSWIERRYRSVDLEVFYFNDTRSGSANCDRTGPELAPGPFRGSYHRTRGARVEWAVPASDEAGVWRVVVVTNDGSIDGANRGRWVPSELADDGSGTWRGSFRVTDSPRLTYVIQAVDRRGNVSWLEHEPRSPGNGVAREIPIAVDVEMGRR